MHMLVLEEKGPGAGCCIVIAGKRKAERVKEGVETILKCLRTVFFVTPPRSLSLSRPCHKITGRIIKKGSELF